MARASIQTQLSLDRFAQIIGAHPLHFNQAQVYGIAEPQVCGMPFLQNSWQSADRIGREEIAQAISDSEQLFAREVGFWPMPKYIAGEFSTLRMNKSWLQHPVLQCLNGYFVAPGKEAQTLVTSGAAVVYNDVDGDSYAETATIMVATTVINPEEIFVYYPGHATPEWEIRPINVTIALGIATITCRRELLYLEDLVSVLNPVAFDGLDDTNYLATVDVYRKYVDISDQGYIKWMGSLCNQCGGVGCSACLIAEQTICVNALDLRTSVIRLTSATYDALTSTYTMGCIACEGNPDQAVINYLAGWRYNNSIRVMDPQFERAIAYLALSQLDRPLCECDHIKALAVHWQEDMALSSSSSGLNVSYRHSQKTFDNPFGTTRGAIYAWRVASKYKIGEFV